MDMASAQGNADRLNMQIKEALSGQDALKYARLIDKLAQEPADMALYERGIMDKNYNSSKIDGGVSESNLFSQLVSSVPRIHHSSSNYGGDGTYVPHTIGVLKKEIRKLAKEKQRLDLIPEGLSGMKAEDKKVLQGVYRKIMHTRIE